MVVKVVAMVMITMVVVGSSVWFSFPPSEALVQVPALSIFITNG